MPLQRRGKTVRLVDSQRVHNASNRYHINPHIEIQTKSICIGTQKRLAVKRQGSYPQGTQSGALVY